MRRPKPEKEVLVPEVKNVGELKEILRRYKEGLERKGYLISAHIVGTLLEDIECVPEDVAAVPREALDRALVHVLTAARVYRVLRDEGWHGKLLGAAKRVIMGDKRVLEKLRERLRNMFPVPEEVHPEHPEEVRWAMERIVDAATKPEVITSLAVKPYPYDYMESMVRIESLYLRVAKRIELARRTHEIIPVKEVAKIISLLEPKAWRSIVEKHQP